MCVKGARAIAVQIAKQSKLYRQGLQEFLAACVILEPSANIQAQDGAFAEGGAEGARRIIFDVENISEHENAAVTRGGRTQELYAFFAHQS